MLKLGDQSIAALRLGGTGIKKAYLGADVVFDVSEPPVPTYTISASIDPDGSGTVTGAGTYQAGETVTITAAPGEGYQFTGWQENGAVVSEDEAYSFTVTGDRALVAVFEVVETSRLPDGYTEVEYIATPDTISNVAYCPYISVPATTGAYSIHYKATSGTFSSNYNAYVYLYVASASATASAYGGGFNSAGAVVMRQGTWNSSTGVFTYTGYTKNSPVEVQVYGPAKYFVIDGVKKSFTGGSTSATPPTRAVRLFYNSTYSAATSHSKGMRIYYISWYDQSGNAVRDLVPCINPSGVVGMYDMIGKSFYKNANTSTNAQNVFVAGPAV